MAIEPNATEITVKEVLNKFESEFAAVANAVENGEFALWVGSGISQQAPSLGGLIERAMEYLRQKSVAAETEASHRPPVAPGHVFCEDEIKEGQRDVLKVVYGDAYNDDIEGIESATLMRAWGEQVLLALVFKLLTDKLNCLMTMSLESSGHNSILVQGLETLLNDLRDYIAEQAIGDRTVFTNGAIVLWSRLLSIFRTGGLPANPEGYEVLSASNPGNLVVDQNAQATGLGNLAVGLALLQHGRAESLWKVDLPQGNGTAAGALLTRATWEGASDRALFFVKSAGEAITLERNGAFERDNAIVIHADDLWSQMGMAGGSARQLRGAPGRTGRAETTHVCLAELLEESNDMNELTQRFVAAATI